ncbi:MAG: hypothetical protein C0597_01475 [Marinilabiliales bacterium]|nr:MAG: hypothetical protein C0597_01475 [Marinilabiliales bacterium]
MKKSYLSLFFLLLLPFLLEAQEEPEKLSVNFSGYVGYSFFFDTYESATTRDGLVYLYPLAENLDVNGDDLNKNFQSQMLSIESRARLTASGLTAFGAKSKAVIEGDFLGTGQDYTRLFRLRHAFAQLDWEKGQLIIGQTWHPLFVTGCYPGVFSFGAGAPFNPLNRAPQIRYTFMPTSNLDFMGALLMHGDFRSSGPSDALQNSGFPDMQFQFRFHNDFIYTGFTAGYKILQPRTQIAATNTKTEEKIGSYNLQLFAKITTKPVIFKIEGIYGENLSHLVMIGGYGADVDPFAPGNEDYSYVNLRTLTMWSEIATNFDSFNGGLFFGYSQNQGASDDYFSLGYSRGENLHSIMRISPRLQYTSGKLTFILEHMLTSAVYGETFDSKGKVEDKADPTINHRIQLGAKYSF